MMGVSIGDAFGDSFFGETNQVVKKIVAREMPETQWAFTDDTVMSITFPPVSPPAISPTIIT